MLRWKEQQLYRCICLRSVCSHLAHFWQSGTSALPPPQPASHFLWAPPTTMLLRRESVVSSCENPTGFHIIIIISNQLSCLDFMKGNKPCDRSRWAFASTAMVIDGDGRDGKVGCFRYSMMCLRACWGTGGCAQSHGVFTGELLISARSQERLDKQSCFDEFEAY